MIVIAWVVLIFGILNTIINLIKMLGSQKAVDRIVYFVVGIPEATFTVILAYYVIFIK
jgi:uncharacterized membrane protein YuzA (DUF378 family)